MLWSKCAKLACILLLFQFVAVPASAQTDSLPLKLPREKIYRVHWKYELPVAAAALGTSIFGFQALDRTSAYDPRDVVHLDPNSINRFDRPVAFANPAFFQTAQERSDLFLNISVLSPVLLALDKKIRNDWFDLLTMYLVSHTVDNALYFAAAFPIRRGRPLTYNPALSEEEKTGIAKSNSFFSGHVSFAATSTFFLAKVFTDYHQIKGLKRVAIFSAAAVPPALVGYYRTRAGKHFRSDVIVGFLVGAGSGILVPEFHRKLQRNDRLTVSPFFGGEQTGFTVGWRL